MSTEAGAEGALPTRKAEHVQVVTGENVQGHYRYWDDIELYHNSLPEFDLDEIDTRVALFGKRLSAPLVITGMTGGYPGATAINRNLARASSELGIALGVGSERAAIIKGKHPESYRTVRKYDVPLKLANVGTPQLIEQRPGEGVIDIEKAREAMELIGAHVLAVHMNFLQEMVQPEGDRRAKGCLSRIEALARHLPVVAKETGAGISLTVARRLKRAKVIGFDVSGRGGTSFAAVEYFRAVKAGDALHQRLGRTFWDWGIPSPVSVMELTELRLPIIASGGIRTGLDAARALSLGAEAVGIAGGIIGAATESFERTLEELDHFLAELKVAMFLTGSRTIREMRKAPKVFRGEVPLWMGQLSHRSLKQSGRRLP